MITGLEILDTAIKMGLGAAITGIISYFSTNKTRRHEMRMSLASDRKDLLRESAMKFEKSSSIINLVNGSAYILATKAGADNDESLETLINDLTNAYNEGKDARALCYLAGQNGLAELMAKCSDTVSELIVHYEEYRLEFDGDFVDQNGDKRTGIRDTVLNGLGDALNSIYG